MPVINKSYFIGDRNIPNTDYVEVSSLVDHLIAVHERKYLLSLMGYDLFKLFSVGIAEVSPDQIWLNILNGVEFTGFDGILKQWRGLKNTTTFESPIADYVYYWYLRFKVNSAAGTGQVQSDNANSIIVSSIRQQVESYNSMVNKSLVLAEYLRINYDVYPNFQYHYGSREYRLLMTKISVV